MTSPSDTPPAAPRNPACDIPGCDCQNGPPIHRCGDCNAALPHHFVSCIHYERTRGYGVVVKAPLVAPAERTAPETPDWAAWKAHLIVCAACTRGVVCREGAEILPGEWTPGDAPWLRRAPEEAAVPTQSPIAGDWTFKHYDDGSVWIQSPNGDTKALSADPFIPPTEVGLLVCGACSASSNWPCSKEPGHYNGHENAFAYWPRMGADTCAPARPERARFPS